MNRPSRHAHKLVRETAVAMGHELYDVMMQDDMWYNRWRRANPELSSAALEEKFVRANLGKLLPQARATLAAMLRGPVNSAVDIDKELIYDALLKDSTLVRGRKQ